MKKKPKFIRQPYVDPFLFEVGFFRDMAERQKMVLAVKKINERIARDKAKIRIDFRTADAQTI